MKFKIFLLEGLLVATSVSAEVATNLPDSVFPFAEISTNLTDNYLHQTLLPMVQDFCAKTGMTNFTQINTNQIKRYRRENFYERPGCMTDLYLTNKYHFTSHTEREKSEICFFQQSQQKTYYSLNDAPVEKIQAVQSLLKQNKLNEKEALALARKYFVALGHDEKNFRPPEIQQGYWVSGNMKYPSGRLPAYTVTWYRKDVTKEQLAPGSGEAMLPEVVIEVSGVDSSLISYHKYFMPVDSDF